ncbi:WXG100 family type VII secretion target [Microbacterium sp. 10M-3C3]|jgi:WXG100 family type VII secretion target|uniref:WXG100 family type VII secretion target n=1 Tax=Microbacterium sp. 10M-3C3 TaxID=2483401 RepID=UPI000F643B53|nr:WXG100 family type VII secretion target [Microbacterium sp. 10M-3C3]
MAVFSVDSDAVLAASGTIRSTVDRLETESASLLSQLTALQGSWTGAASAAFSGVVEQWRGTQRQVAAALAEIDRALTLAARQYAEVEQASTSLFR